MELKAYLDNAATTKPFASVQKAVLKAMEEDFGNPSSLHTKGVEAEQYIKEARELIASSLKVQTKEILFTSGGTESNNMALLGTAMAKKRSGTHIITTRIEHASVHEPLLFLEESGYDITFLDVDAYGHISPQAVADAIREDTVLVSIMYVNNEIGAVMDIDGIGQAIKQKKKDVVFHVDAIQAYGKYRIFPKKEGIDLMSVSGHKIHGPKGVGFLYVSDQVRIKPILFGGGQQKGMRSGTENVPGITGLGAAVKEIYTGYEEKKNNLYQLKQYFIEEMETIEGVTINGIHGQNGTLPLLETAPHVVSVSFEGIRSEVLLHALADKGICVSSGSACSSNHPQISGTLKAIGVKDSLLDATLRFSFSVHTGRKELEYTVEELRGILPVLRKFTRK